MKNIYLSFGIALLFLSGTACFTEAQIQTFEKSYGGINGDFGRAMGVTSDSGFIIAGQTTRQDTCGDTYLLKVDKTGEKQWEKIIGGNKLEGGNSVTQTTDGGYLVTNHTESYGAGDCDSWVVKTDKNGTISWSATYGGLGDDIGEQGIETSEGNYIVTGLERSLAPSADAFLTKYDGSGNLIWSKTYGGSEGDAGIRLLEAPDGGYIVAGQTSTNSTGVQDIMIFKTNAAGDLTWLKNFGGTGREESLGICAAPGGGFVISGLTTSFGSGDEDAYLLKIDGNGNLLWSKNYGGLQDDVANSVAVSADGGFVMTGYTKSFCDTLDLDAFIIKTDEFGNQVWMKTFGEKDYWKECQWIVACPDGGFAMTGSVTSRTGAYNPELYLLKTDNEGNVAATIDEPPFPLNHAIVYPDPAIGTINLWYDNIITNPEIRIYNNLGEKVFQGQNQKSVDISKLPSGIYYLTLKHDAEFFSQKFMHN